MEDLLVIKAGGATISSIDDMRQLAATLAKTGKKVLLVHGGGRQATAMGNRLGIKSQYHEGRRITDADTLDLVTMVYGGLINKTLTALLQFAGVNALGLCGADGDLLRATQRPATGVNYGYAGDLGANGVNTTLLKTLLTEGYVPVIASLTHDGAGQLLNTNADTIATAVAQALVTDYAVTLVYCFDRPGVLLNANDMESVIPAINKQTFERLRHEGMVSEGMIPKLQTAFNAVDTGVDRVIMGLPGQLLEMLQGNAGTTISR